jgi:hypothetical protein
MKMIHVYNGKLLLLRAENPHPDIVLSWIARLDGERVTTVRLITSSGQLEIGCPCGETLLVRFANNRQQVVGSSQTFSKQSASEMALFFLDNEGLPAGNIG